VTSRSPCAGPFPEGRRSGRGVLEALVGSRPGRRRLATLAAVCLAASGCSLIQKQPIPLPFGVQPDYGRVVASIIVEGNDVTDESLILSTLVTHVGAVYTAADAVRNYNRLLQLGIFTAIVFRTEEIGEGIALTVEVAEASPYLPAVSFALTEENGVEIGPSFSSPNLFGRATKASAFVRFGGARNLGLTVRDSWRPTEAWYECCWNFEYYHRERQNELSDFREGSDEVTLQYLYNVADRWHVGPRFEYLVIRDLSASAASEPRVILGDDDSDELPGIGVVLEYEGRNLTNYPTQGWYLWVSAMQRGGFLGGPADYPRLEVDLRRYIELNGPRHSFAAYSLLSMTGGQVGVDIPIHQYFYLGGTNSVRGWPLGSRNGKNQWILTVEDWWNILPSSAYRFLYFRWSMGLQLAAFADAATAWNTSEEFRSNWIAGFGVGARLIIPQVALVRFDFAVGRLEPDFRIAFHIGTGERAEAQKRRVR